MVEAMLAAMLARVASGEHLTQDEMADVVDALMRGACGTEVTAGLLLALANKGETIEEVTGAAMAMRRHMITIPHDRETLLDTCGTGGDGCGTFNISTAAAIVAAAAGIPVAKHGNRSVSSKTGSADVLEALGVHIEADLAVVERCLNELGICFCYAPLLHPAMKHVAPVRKQLAIRTIFNLLGPLCNPACAPYQMIGTASQELRELLGSALARLGTKYSITVCGEDGCDEVSLAGPTRVTQVQPNGEQVLTWNPEQFGLEPQPLERLRVENAAESAAMIRQVLDGEHGPARDVVVLNAAAAIWTAEESNPTLEEAAQRAAAVLDDGAARQLLEEWVRVSRT